jgi:hypothetical protein
MFANILSVSRALITLFDHTREPLTIDDVEAALPHIDRHALRASLHTLVCLIFVRQAIRRADERLVYWLAGVTVAPFDGVLFHYAPNATFADVDSISGKPRVLHA